MFAIMLTNHDVSYSTMFGYTLSYTYLLCICFDLKKIEIFHSFYSDNVMVLTKFKLLIPIYTKQNSKPLVI